MGLGDNLVERFNFLWERVLPLFWNVHTFAGLDLLKLTNNLLLNIININYKFFERNVHSNFTLFMLFIDREETPFVVMLHSYLCTSIQILNTLSSLFLVLEAAHKHGQIFWLHKWPHCLVIEVQNEVLYTLFCLSIFANNYVFMYCSKNLQKIKYKTSNSFN